MQGNRHWLSLSHRCTVGIQTAGSADTRYDGRPAYTLVYRAYHSFCGDINMVDEVRRLGDGLYLGIGTWGFTERQRRVALPFLLQQTPDAYRGDVGKARRGFVLSRRELPARAK